MKWRTERHYWNQLPSALTTGQWASSSLAKAPNGSPLLWSELFHKFNKHCKGFSDIATSRADTDKPVKSEEYALELGNECILLPEQVKEARAVYDILKNLESSNFDTLNFALAYYAYALGDPSKCLSHLSKVPDVSHVQNHIPLPSMLRASI
ncbi:hypothetical protein GYMLUDRAFT_69991 [Collybiopsis luxurians FD-317 M1]|nr:hypothetical protein GYMLUDRAFT_69991 [Collybiopsis luxurians FD-317 M1]